MPNFEAAVAFFSKVGEHEPLTLAIDDTELTAKIRTYEDPGSNGTWVIGHVGDPIFVANDDGLYETIANAANDKGTKVNEAGLQRRVSRGGKAELTYVLPLKLRAFLLSTNRPKIPSFLISAMVINSPNAEELFNMSNRVFAALREVGLLSRVVSIATDGAATEMSVHKMVTAANPTETWTIKSTSALFDHVDIVKTFLGGTPTFFPIDSKHTGKNCRSASDSGARALVLGNHLICHAQVAAVADNEAGPLVNRDVYRRDRQDDASMERFLSSAMIGFVANTTPAATGLIVYLFICGELLSAVQSRAMPHVQRIRILLTVLFFLDGWKKFVALHPDYHSFTQFISRDLYAIIHRLCTQMIGIIFNFRDMAEENPMRSIALFPWRHSTEMLEHFFGIARQQIKDFDALDLTYMATRIATLLRLEADAEGVEKPEGQGRAGMGYQHTYNDTAGLNAEVLSTYFSEDDVEVARNAVSMGT